jgi:hypothetical protein
MLQSVAGLRVRARSGYGLGVRVQDLQRAAQLLGLEYATVAPAGPMGPFLGPQLSEDELRAAYEARTDGLEQLRPDVLRSIRSFPVSALVGAELECEPDMFGDRLRALLAERLPGTDWPQSWFAGRGRDGLVERYHLLDTAFPAPADAATGQPMVLELGGGVAAVAGTLADGEPFPARVLVTVSHAHWCNVSGLGIGVGFYM